MPNLSSGIFTTVFRSVNIKFTNGRKLLTRYKVQCKSGESLKAIMASKLDFGISDEEMKSYEEKADIVEFHIRNWSFTYDEPFTIIVNKQLLDKDDVLLFEQTSTYEAEEMVLMGIDFAHVEK